MQEEVTKLWTELLYHMDELLHCIHLKAILASLPIAYATHFLGDWHLLEIYFGVSVVDLALGILLARKKGIFSWQRIHSWSVKILVHFSSVAVVGVIAHAASIAAKCDVYILNAYVALLTIIEISAAVVKAKALKLPVPYILAVIVAVVNKKAHKHIFKVLEEEIPETIKNKLEAIDEDLKADKDRDK